MVGQSVKRRIVEKNRTRASGNTNQEKEVVMGRTHNEKARKQHYKSCPTVEPTRKKEAWKTITHMETDK